MTKKGKLVLANNPLLSGPAYNERDRIGIPYRVLAVNAIDPDPNQPRVSFDEERLDELTKSIKTYGVLSPILVRPGMSPGRFTLISGERRLRAAQRAGLVSIPALIDQHDDASDTTKLAIQLVENLQRADLTSLERAHAIGALRDTYNLSVRDIAEKLGISKSMVQRSLEILELPDDLLNALKEGASESKVLLLSKITDEEIRASYLKDLEALTRTDIQQGISRAVDGNRAGDYVPSPEDKRIAEEIQRSLGLRVRISRPSASSEQGKLSVEFYSEGDLQEVFRRLVAIS